MHTSILLLETHKLQDAQEKNKQTDFSFGERNNLVLRAVWDICVHPLVLVTVHLCMKLFYFVRQRSIKAIKSSSFQTSQYRAVVSCLSLCKYGTLQELHIVFPEHILHVLCCTLADAQQMALCGNWLTASFCKCDCISSMYNHK